MVLRLLSGMLHAGRRAQDSTALKLGMELATALRSEGYIKAADLISIWFKGSMNDLTTFCRAAVWLIAHCFTSKSVDLGIIWRCSILD